jgi:hypothetical protein
MEARQASSRNVMAFFGLESATAMSLSSGLALLEAAVQTDLECRQQLAYSIGQCARPVRWCADHAQTRVLWSGRWELEVMCSDVL